MRRDDEIQIEPLVVSRCHRGRGVGSALVGIALNEARASGVKYLSVRPVARNSEAIGFFSRRGFGNVGHVELFVDLSGKEWRRGLELHGIQFRH